MSRYALGAVVRCGDLIAGVHGSVTSLVEGSTGAAAIAIVAERSTPPGADPWLTAFASARGWRFLRVDTDGPGGAWNAGLAAIGPVDVALCVEAGDRIDSPALGVAAACLSSNPDVVIVTSGVEWTGPGSRRRVTDLAGCSPVELLAEPHAAHSSSLFRWQDWQRSPGFDDRLATLEHTDFWLKLLAGGGRIAAGPSPWLRRRVHARALYRRTWGTDEYRHALETLFDAHAAIAFADPAALLERSEAGARATHFDHMSEKDTLENVERETAALVARRQNLLDGVPPDWEPAPDLGGLARTSPLSHAWGYDRGTPADRPLIERYLAAHAGDIHGTVLEIQEDDYTRRFGGERIDRADVLDVDVTNTRANIIGDLRAIDHIASATYDCVILTQTLHVIDDMDAVVRGCERVLKPGGVLLATLPCASRVCLEYGPDADFWRVTEAGARHLFERVFPPTAVETSAAGNAVVNAAFSLGLASEELPAGAYDAVDPYFPMIVGVRAVKPLAAPRGPALMRRETAAIGVILMYHRVGESAVDPHRLFVSEGSFKAQLAWLRQACKVLPLVDLVDGPRAPDGKLAVALTFDDGYLDNFVVAAPALRDAGLPATFFLTTGEGRDPYHYWWDRLAHALLGSATVPPALTVNLPGGPRLLETATTAQRAQAHALIYDAVVRLPATPRDAIVGGISAWAGHPALGASDRRMTADEIRELASSPQFTIGAHTVQHLYLPAQADHAITRELRDSRTALQTLTGSAVDTVAYPFAAYDSRAIAAAREAGFRLAVIREDRAVNAADDVLALPRLGVTQGSLESFVAGIAHVSRVSS